MASLPGFRFDLMGASGSTGLLSPKSSWRAIILPRGGTIAQDSSGTLLTFDSASVASRFAADVWVQVGLSIANIRKVSAVGGDSISVSGSAVTASENDRCFLIGTTQPSTSGGSATYTIPDTIVRQRDDDGATIFTNSTITSNSDGLIQGFAETNFYDCIIQDGNRSNQGSVIDLPVGVVEGVSVSTDALFGANVTVNGALGVTGVATFGSTVTMAAQLGVTGHATFGDTVTVHGNFGVTGHSVFGETITVVGTSGNYEHTGTVVFGDTITVTNNPRVRVFLGATGFPTSGAGANNFLGWSDELYDVGGMFASGSSTVITVPEDGTYLFNAGIVYPHSIVGDRWVTIVHGTSETDMVHSSVNGVTVSPNPTVVNASATMYATSGSTFTVRGNQNSGSTLTVGDSGDNGTFFSAVKIS